MDNNKLFRKESMDRISSPEQLHDYMRVTTPRLWMLLAAILVLAAGFVVYACTATMESTMDLTVKSEYGDLYANLPVSQLEVVKLRMPLRVEGRTGYVSNIYQINALRFELVFDGSGALEDGFYTMTFEDREGLQEEMASEEHYLWVTDGTITTYEVLPAFVEAFRTERRVRVEGRLATITKAEPYDMVTVSFLLDDPGEALPDGTYHAQLVTETTTPISFLLN